MAEITAIARQYTITGPLGFVGHVYLDAPDPRSSISLFLTDAYPIEPVAWCVYSDADLGVAHGFVGTITKRADGTWYAHTWDGPQADHASYDEALAQFQTAEVPE
jgi:hypothetical protein